MLVRSVSLDTWVVGIDDTDTPDLGGTGRLARRLAAEIDALGLGQSQGVTRHQFFEGPGVPKTARNSAAAIALAGVVSVAGLFEMVCDVVAGESVDGSDPGVAIGSGPVSPGLVEFARRAQKGLVTQAEARTCGAVHAEGLVGLGRTGGGVIGALGAMALRLDGDDGRFVDLAGIREVSGLMTVAEVLDRTAIAAIVDVEENAPLARTNKLELGEWVRPRLMGGRPVLTARRVREKWVNADSRPR
jgi:hypothetical protein